MNSAYISALYPQLNFDVMKEVRPVHWDHREIADDHSVLIFRFAFQVSGSVLLFRLPESDQVKSNVKRVTIDYGAIQEIIKEWFYSYNMTIQVCSLLIMARTKALY